MRRLHDGLGDLATVVEFRNEGWLTDATFDLLRELQLGFCCVDEPRLKGLFPPIAKATGPVAYLRVFFQMNCVVICLMSSRDGRRT